MDAAAAQHAEGRLRPARLGRLLVEAVLALVVLALFAGTFVGMDRSGYWIDELWALYVVDPSLSLSEVLQRAMTDTHPPGFYLLAHGWVRVFGEGETATRTLSALCCVGAGVLFIAWNKAGFSRPARLFGAAVGASSFFWFKQSQNLRGYAPAVLVLAALLGCAVAAKQQNRAGRPVSYALCAGIAALGLLGALLHYYAFLTVGLLYLALLVTIPDRRLRLTLLLSGGVIVAVVLGYMQAARPHLLFTNLWFSNSPDALLGALSNAWSMAADRWAKYALLILAIGALYGLMRRQGVRPGGDLPRADLRSWIAGVSLFVALGLTVAGLAVSLLVQPSFSARNLLIAAPCLWHLSAWVFDRALESGPKVGLLFAGAASLLMAATLPALQGRLVNRVEDWRGSARYVSALPACRGREIPVVLPDVFGPDTPFFRRLAERDLFGWYYRGGGRLLAKTRGELASSRDPKLVTLLQARASGADSCPVLAWAVHDVSDKDAEDLAQALARRPEMTTPVRIRRIASYRRTPDGWRPGWPAAYVFEAARPGA